MRGRLFDRALRKHRPDYGFILAIALLLLLGLIVIYSISPVLSHKLLGQTNHNYFLYGQLLHIGLGLVGFGVAANLHYSKWQKLLPLLLILTGLSLLLLGIPATGLNKNGATRWVSLGPITFQPSEIIKFVLVLGLAVRFSLAETIAKTRLRTAIGVLLILGLLVLFLQRDMGTMVVIAAIATAQLFVSGVPLKQVLNLLVVGLLMAIGSIIIFPHRLARWLTFLNPDQNPTSSGYHLNQALIAIGSGGLLGLGIGKSIQVYGYLPEAANDSIFAIIGETFGFVGSLAVIGLLGLLLYRGLRIAMSAPSRYAQLVVVGVMVWIGTQTIVNMAAMLGLIPLTGIPLPFLSYGGTSLVVIMTAVGVVVNISKYTKRGLYADSALRRRDRRPHYADAFGSSRP